MTPFFYRQNENDLMNWFHKRNRKPLVVRGARQVGKSTLIREFCRKNKIELFEVNLEKHLNLKKIFASNNSRIIIESIEDILNKQILKPKQSLFFLDEIQSIPESLLALRYLFEDRPDLPIVAAGSLLDFLFNNNEYSIPVGRIEFMYIGPLNFTEFLLAKKEKYIYEKLNSFKSLTEISDSFHNQCLDLAREYMFVGGLPEAVRECVLVGPEAASIIHDQIIQTYRLDFLKYAKRTHQEKIQKVFDYVIRNPCKKIKLTNISREDSHKDLKLNLELLILARIITPVFHSNCEGLPVEATEVDSVFKLLSLDVGLMNHVQGHSWKEFKAFKEVDLLNEGPNAEQFIGQHLLYNREYYQEPRLHYWLREGKSKNAEVDFIVQNNSSLVAIEVKSGVAGKIRSLHQWMHDIKVKKKLAIRFNLSQGAVESVSQIIDGKKIQYKLVSLPLYLIEQWRNFIPKL